MSILSANAYVHKSSQDSLQRNCKALSLSMPTCVYTRHILQMRCITGVPMQCLLVQRLNFETWTNQQSLVHGWRAVPKAQFTTPIILMSNLTLSGEGTNPFLKQSSIVRTNLPTHRVNNLYVKWGATPLIVLIEQCMRNRMV